MGKTINTTDIQDGKRDSRNSKESLYGTMQKTTLTAGMQNTELAGGYNTNAIQEEENEQDDILKQSSRDNKGVVNMNATIDWFSSGASARKKA